MITVEELLNALEGVDPQTPIALLTTNGKTYDIQGIYTDILGRIEIDLKQV